MQGLVCNLGAMSFMGVRIYMNGCDKKQGHKILPAQHYKLAVAEWWQICQFLKVRPLGKRFKF